MKTDRNKKDNTRRDQSREEKRRREQTPNRGDRNLYCKYHKQNEHDTKECRDLLEFVEQGLKNGKFHEYTGKYRQKDDDRRVRQRVNNPESKADRKKDDSKERGVHREIAMISGGIPEVGSPLLRKRQKEADSHAWRWK
ncbi:hypothetical protein PIB30_078755 [Stylosanthes scabra]|uniref:Uncharacterized protein n=1 Tax=Stylosanthes scabra TaxID=79078 RepID=A0ABU6RQN9_9FABA|nr:hypothetical protein [Stylosanthes scabra]